MGICIAVMRRGWPHITFLSVWAGLYVCRLVGTSGHSSFLSVLPCPLTCMFTFDMCAGCPARRYVIMSGPRHAPPFSSSFFFEVLSMEGFITWKSLLCKFLFTSVLYHNNRLLPGSTQQASGVKWTVQRCVCEDCLLKSVSELVIALLS